jgi:hypothetical protein
MWTRPKHWEMLKAIPPPVKDTEHRAGAPTVLYFPEDDLFNALMRKKPRMRMEFQQVYDPSYQSLSGRFARVQWDLMDHDGLSETDAFARTEESR